MLDKVILSVVKATFCKQAGVNTESKIVIAQYATEQNNKQCSRKKNALFHFFVYDFLYFFLS